MERRPARMSDILRALCQEQKKENPTMERKCPHCGADLPENAAFCPHCAKDIHPRKQAKTANPLLKKLLVGLLILVVAAAIGGAVWYCNRPYEPQEFDALGEVYYESGDKT